MEPRYISKKSLTCRLADIGGLDTAHDTTICLFRTACCAGAVRIFFFTTVVAFACVMLGIHELIFWLYTMLTTLSYVAPNDTVTTLLVSMGGLGMAAALVVLVAFCVKHGTGTKTKTKKEPKPSALVMAYRSWRDKSCYRVTFKE